MGIQPQLTSIIKNYNIHSKGLNKSIYRNNRGSAHSIHGMASTHALSITTVKIELNHLNIQPINKGEVPYLTHRAKQIA